MSCCIDFGRTARSITSVQPAGFSRSPFYTPTVVDRLVPFRKLLIIATVITFCMAFLVILECTLYVSANQRQAWIILLPYFASWILLIIGFLFSYATYIVCQRKKDQFRRERRVHFVESSRAPSPTQSLATNSNVNPNWQIPLPPCTMCDHSAGPQIFLSSPYMGYSPFPFYPPGVPMHSQNPFHTNGHLGFSPCDLRVPSPHPSSGLLSPRSSLSPLSPMATAPTPDAESMMAIVPGPEPPTYLEAVREAVREEPPLPDDDDETVEE